MQYNNTQKGSLKVFSGQQVGSHSTTLNSARVLAGVQKAV